MKLRLWPANEKQLRKMAKESKTLSMDKIGNWIIASFIVSLQQAEKAEKQDQPKP
jgi:hypothetical protein